jgi:hypothetical protein
MKTHWKKAFNKDYLGSHDLDEKDLKVVIDHVEVREVKDTSGKSSKCNVAIFKGNVKPMILNVTNCKTIKRFSCSNYIEEWSDIAVTIYIDNNVKAFGEITEGLRIRPKQPIIEKPELTPTHEAWQNAIKYLNEPDSTMDKITRD